MEQLLATRSPATASNRYRALQQFFAWLDAEEVIAVIPMAKMKLPAVPEQPVPILGDDEVRALLATCSGKTLEDRRDKAIIRLLYDTGMRRAELLGMTVRDLDLDGQIAVVTGKGRRHRACPFGAKTARARRAGLRAAVRAGPSSTLHGMLSPSERAMRARIAAFALHAQRDPRETTRPARSAFMARFERQADPGGILPAAERQRRAEAAMRAHFTSLALRSAKARRRRAQP
jgi:site-specific recombinase XerD